MKEKVYLTLSDEFIKFCEMNKIEDIQKAAKETFERGFTILKYGDSPNIKVPQTLQKEGKKEEKVITPQKIERDIYKD